MKKIKTIVNRLDNHEAFDEEVNAAIAQGWELKKREVLQPSAQPTEGHILTPHLYAELERNDDADAVEEE